MDSYQVNTGYESLWIDEDDDLRITVKRLKKRNNKYYKAAMLRVTEDEAKEELHKNHPGLKDLWDQYQTMLQLVKDK